MLSSFIFRKKKRNQAAQSNMLSPVDSPLVSISPKPLGLKTIADSSLDSPRRSNCVKRSFVAASPSSPTAINDGGVGCEDEDEEVVVVEEEEEEEDNACWATYGGRNRSRRRFPPPIPLLARTGNLAGHMPWVLRRIYKDDGRLVIQEVRVEHHEYFRARRRDGRLTLQLIELDDRRRSEEIELETEEMEKGDESPSSSPYCSSEEVESTPERDEEDRGFESAPAMRIPWSASSPLPEPMCGTESFEKGGGRPLHLQLPLSRMRMVHG